MKGYLCHEIINLKHGEGNSPQKEHNSPLLGFHQCSSHRNDHPHSSLPLTRRVPPAQCPCSVLAPWSQEQGLLRLLAVGG